MTWRTNNYYNHETAGYPLDFDNSDVFPRRRVIREFDCLMKISRRFFFQFSQFAPPLDERIYIDTLYVYICYKYVCTLPSLISQPDETPRDPFVRTMYGRKKGIVLLERRRLLAVIISRIQYRHANNPNATKPWRTAKIQGHVVRAFIRLATRVSVGVKNNNPFLNTSGPFSSNLVSLFKIQRYPASMIVSVPKPSTWRYIYNIPPSIHPEKTVNR